MSRVKDILITMGYGLLILFAAGIGAGLFIYILVVIATLLLMIGWWAIITLPVLVASYFVGRIVR